MISRIVQTFLLAICITTSVWAQSKITVRVVDGGGRRFHGHVRLSWDDLGSPVNLETDQLGRIVVDVPHGVTHLRLAPGSKPSEPYRIAYLPCTNLPPIGYEVAEILRIGLSSGNACGSKIAIKVQPGEVAFYEETLHWWRDFQ